MVAGNLTSVGASRPNIHDYKECARKEKDRERSGASKGSTSASSSSGTQRVLSKQKTMPTPRKLFEEDELISADMSREIQHAWEQRNPPPQQPAAPTDAPLWSTHMERMFDKQGQRLEGLFIAPDRRISMLEDKLLAAAKKTQSKMLGSACLRAQFR